MYDEYDRVLVWPDKGYKLMVGLKGKTWVIINGHLKTVRFYNFLRSIPIKCMYGTAYEYKKGELADILECEQWTISDIDESGYPVEGIKRLSFLIHYIEQWLN